MEESNRPSSVSKVTIDALEQLLTEFEDKLKDGTRDPDHFMTMSEIEELWGKLIGDTHVLYSNMLRSIIESSDEKEMVRKKKRIPDAGDLSQDQ